MWAEAEPKRLDSVRKMLKLTKGWEEAREHALKVSSSSSSSKVSSGRQEQGGSWMVEGMI